MEVGGKIKKGARGRKGCGPKKKSVTSVWEPPVYLVVVLEYLVPEKLGKLLSSVTIAHGGVLPNINHVLLLKKTDKASKEPKSPSKTTKSPKKA
ncbi:hypothetical protein ACSQ67_006225 [Phaseolus vulgaris]